MANKRMFSKQITTSDAFVDMPVSSQLLYFHLNMEADDDGFVANPKRIMRMLNVSDDDFKILLAKRFILAFDSGVIVIKHWLLHNAVRKDMYKETQYLEEKKTLQIKDNGVYTETRNEDVTKSLHRLDKIRLDKSRLDKSSIGEDKSSQDIISIIEMFTKINPACKRMYGNTTQRKACKDLIDTYSLDRVLLVIEETLPKTNKMTAEFFPNISTPLQLFEKWQKLEDAIIAYRAKKQIKSNNVIW